MISVLEIEKKSMEQNDTDDSSDERSTSIRFRTNSSPHSSTELDALTAEGVSLPNPDEIPRARGKKTNKIMQNIAGVAGNILEW